MLEPRQALLAGEQFLHGALFEVAFLGDELLQGFDEGIRIAQRLGDGFLFGWWWERNGNAMSSAEICSLRCVCTLDVDEVMKQHNDADTLRMQCIVG